MNHRFKVGDKVIYARPCSENGASWFTDMPIGSVLVILEVRDEPARPEELLYPYWCEHESGYGWMWADDCDLDEKVEELC